MPNHFYEPQFPTREPRPRITEAKATTGDLLKAIKPGQPVTFDDDDPRRKPMTAFAAALFDILR